MAVERQQPLHLPLSTKGLHLYTYPSTTSHSPWRHPLLSPSLQAGSLQKLSPHSLHPPSGDRAVMKVLVWESWGAERPKCEVLLQQPFTEPDPPHMSPDCMQYTGRMGCKNPILPSEVIKRETNFGQGHHIFRSKACTYILIRLD